MRTLDELTMVRVDQSGPSDDEEFTYVDIGSVDNLSKKIVGPKRVAASAAPSRAKQTLRAGDVIVSMTRPNLNAVALVPPALDGAIGSSGFHVLRAHADVLPEWLYFGVQTRRFIDAMSNVVQGALYPAVRPRDIRAFSLPVPSVSAQRNVVDDIETQFSRLDQAIAGLQRIKVNLARHQASMLRDAIESRLVKPSAPWTTLPLSEVAEVQLGQQRAPVHAEAAVQLPYVRAANITWSGLDVTDVKTMGFPNPARYQLADGDILLSEASGSAKEVGKPALWRNEIPGACYQKTLIRVRSDRSRLLPEFAYYFFLHTCLSGQFARLAPGVGILHLTAERMLSWPTVVPPLADQQRVVAEVERRLSIARGVEAQVDANLRRAQSLRQAVLDKAFALEA